jgi:DNA-binding response OmpR family regulator
MLLVESDPGIHEVIRLSLSAHGCAVLSAYTALEATRIILERHRVDGALINILVDRDSGLELCAQLRRRQLHDVPIAILSRRLRRSDDSRALLAGATAFLPLPLDEAALRRWLRDHRIAS